MDYPVTKHITSKTTTNIANESVVVSQIVFLCTDIGTAWTLTIRDKATTPRTWFGPFTLALPSDGKPTIMNFTFPMYMESGVDVVTGGTTAGVLDIQMI